MSADASTAAPPTAEASAPGAQLEMLCDPGSFRKLRSGVEVPWALT